jgi:hypothetical protein
VDKIDRPGAGYYPLEKEEEMEVGIATSSQPAHSYLVASSIR